MGMLSPARALREPRADPLDLNDIRRLVDIAATKRGAARNVLHALLSTPRFQSVAEIISQAWPDPDEEPDDPDQHIPALVWWMRPSLLRSGYEIVRESPGTRFARYRIERRQEHPCA